MGIHSLLVQIQQERHVLLIGWAQGDLSVLHLEIHVFAHFLPQRVYILKDDSCYPELRCA